MKAAADEGGLATGVFVDRHRQPAWVPGSASPPRNDGAGDGQSQPSPRGAGGAFAADDITEDALLGGRVRLLQPRLGHRAGTDAVLLAGLAPTRPKDAVLDLGSASGAVGLMVAACCPETRIAFLDREPHLAELCRRNIDLNGLGDRGRAAAADIFLPERWPEAGLAAGAFDLVVTNPPFFDAGARPSPGAGRRAARTMEGGDLAGWLAGAARLLQPRGRLALIHRADHLDRCLAALAPGFGSLELRPIYAREGEAASRVLISAVKGGRAALRLLGPLTLHEADGRFTEAGRALHEGEGWRAPSRGSNSAGGVPT